MRTMSIGVGTGVALALLSAGPALAQPSDELKTLKQEVEALKQSQATMQGNLQEILKLLRATPPGGAPAAPAAPAVKPADVALRVEGAPFRGEKDAVVTLIEFSDYQCPFCGRHFRETLPQIRKDYIDTGKLRYVFRDFPIEPIHPQAFKAAEAARCAGEQGQYWEMHDLIMGNQRALSVKGLGQNAEALGLKIETFQQCLDSGRYAADIRTDMEDGKKNGVSATPAFFLGMTAEDGSFKVTRLILGAQPFATFKEAIDGLLSAQKR